MHVIYRERSGQAAGFTAAGFTLVELAIVITIIGLLIGGILKGQEMINNAKVTATIAQVKSYQAALETFRDRFDNLPGDFSRASSRLPGCTAANYCYDGDGNGRVGVADTNGIGHSLQTGTGTPQRETSLFFKHLALADLISGVNPSANIASAVWGQTHPSAPISGGWNITHNAGGGNATNGWIGNRSGHYLRLQNSLTGSPYASTGACNLGPNGNLCQPVEAISPRDGAVIDRKIDDGRSSTGDVIADDRGGGSSPCEDGGTSGYDETEISRQCIMHFRIF